MIEKTIENIKNQISEHVGIEVFIRDYKEFLENEVEFSVFSIVEDRRFNVYGYEQGWNIRHIDDGFVVEDVHVEGWKEVLEFIKDRVSIMIFNIFVKNHCYIVRYGDCERYFRTLDDAMIFIEEKVC